MIDHLLWAVPELEAGRQDFESRSGILPAPGGRHPGVGTHNALLSLGPEVYLELIAPDPTQDRFTGLGELLRDLQEPKLLTWCARTDDLDSVAQRAHQAGLALGDPVAMSRTRPDGVELRWRIFLLDAHDLGTVIPFFIEWNTPHHPAATAPYGCVLESFGVRHPRAGEVREVFGTLGLEVSVETAEEAGLEARLGTPRGVLVL